MSEINRGELLANIVSEATRGSLLAAEKILEIEQEVAVFQPNLSIAVRPVIDDFLKNSSTVAQLSFDTISLLVLDNNLSENFEKAVMTSPSDQKPRTDPASAMLDFYEFSLLIVISLHLSSGLHHVLSELSEKPKPTKEEVTREIAAAGLGYLKGLAMRLTLVEEAQEAMELLKELDAVSRELSKSKITLTLEHLSMIDREIETFSRAAQIVARILEIQTFIQGEAEKFIQRTTSTIGK